MFAFTESYIWFCCCSESPASESEGAQSNPVKNKHSEEDPAEAEGHEVKRLKFDKEGEARDAPNQTASSEVSSGMGEETEASSTSQDKEKDATCARQHCTEKEEEGISHFTVFFFPRSWDFLLLETSAAGIAEGLQLCLKKGCLFIIQFCII